jgi:phosphoribosylformylglycinamidine synthase
MKASLATTDVSIAESLGLSGEEYEMIKEYLGRTPNFTELSIYSVMWSEHCSYKNSIKYLKTLPNTGEHLLVGAGEENAGLVDIGEGLGCAFKIESHNHPSAIEPYQGAATGVGGIHRDIFTMGARPIAALNSLRFGDPNNKHMQHLIRGVVKGIGDYGNCLGVPTVGGEVYFEDCYQQNILVNAMSAGIVKAGETISASADGPGNPVFIVGSATGKDGIHGATFASAELTEDSADDLPSVQVGDPFQEKLLLEASLEAIQTGALVGMQDMGAAGISCSTSEMSAKSGTGMKINLDHVPTRQDDMEPFEMLLSESQERMLIVVKKGREQEILDIFDKWDLECSEIGEVADTKMLEFYFQGQKVAHIPADSLVLGGGAPVYDRSYRAPAYLSEVKAFDPNKIDVPNNLKEVAEFIISRPSIASKSWIYEQYDHTVRTNNLNTLHPSDASVVRVKGTKKALAMSVDCNSAYIEADPEVGTMIAVSEAARNVSCSGAQPMAITNCLNFGNPYNEEVYYQFVNAIAGMRQACEALNTPVTGGNVSFYNESQGKTGAEPVFPTPVIGMLGLIQDTDHICRSSFGNSGDLIYILGPQNEDISCSTYVRKYHNIRYSPAPFFNMEKEVDVQKIVRLLIQEDFLESAHDVSDGGSFTSLVESATASNLGFDVRSKLGLRNDAFWFGESQSRIIVTITPERQGSFQEFLNAHDYQHVCRLGRVTKGAVLIDEESWGDINHWGKIYKEGLTHIIES